MVKKAAALLAVGALVLVGCSSDSESTDTDSGNGSSGGGTSSDTAMTDDTTTDDTTTDGTASGASGDCEETAIELAGTEIGADGEVDVALAVHDMSDVSTNNAGIMITSFEPELDPQFGLTIPAGVPDVPEDEVYIQFELTGLDMGPGEYSSDVQNEDPQRVTFTSVYVGSERLLPLEDYTVEVTEVSEEMICGSITPAGDTAIQQFPNFSGTFTAVNIDTVEEEMEAAAG